MKKSIIFGLMAASLTLVGCSKNADALIGRYKDEKKLTIFQIDPADKDGMYQVKILSYVPDEIMGVKMSNKGKESVAQVLQTFAIEKNRLCTKTVENTRCFELNASGALVTKNPNTGETVAIAKMK